MKKVLKRMLKILIVLIILITLMGIFVWKEFGNNPTKEEFLSYEKLSYFKDGTFQSPQKMVYDFNNVRNGPAGFIRFLKKSIFAPTGNLPKILLTKESFSQSVSDFSVYWLGHSAAIMELDGKRIIFDPVLGNAAPIPFAVPRFDRAPIERENLPEVDYVVITHNHYDHLERKTIQAIKNAHFIVPLGVGVALRGWGVEANRITELGWGESFEKNGLKIVAEEGVHYSNRSPFNRNKTLWNSYILLSLNKKIFWGGDTGYGEHFARIGKEYGPFDFAALEIDGWNTGWANTHLFPQEVVQAAKDLNVKHVLPIHWAVFDLALHPWHESIDMVLEEAKDTNINIVTPMMGEKIDLEKQTSYWWRD